MRTAAHEKAAKQHHAQPQARARGKRRPSSSLAACDFKRANALVRQSANCRSVGVCSTAKTPSVQRSFKHPARIRNAFDASQRRPFVLPVVATRVAARLSSHNTTGRGISNRRDHWSLKVSPNGNIPRHAVCAAINSLAALESAVMPCFTEL